jgi:hypothetical protein
MLHTTSHLDHGLTQLQLQWLLEHFQDRDSYFIETVELPEHLGLVPCAIYGPIMGDPPVPEAEVILQCRGDRKIPSRMIRRPLRYVRIVTVIAGPRDELPCVLYTAFGGPPAPHEPDDPTCTDRARSEAFWAEHALALGDVVG